MYKQTSKLDYLNNTKLKKYINKNFLFEILFQNYGKFISLVYYHLSIPVSDFFVYLR